MPPQAAPKAAASQTQAPQPASLDGTSLKDSYIPVFDGQPSSYMFVSRMEKTNRDLPSQNEVAETHCREHLEHHWIVAGHSMETCRRF